MAKGRAAAADKVLAAMVKDYKRLRRSLTEGGAVGDDPELAVLLQRKKALAQELREVRQTLAALKKSPRKKLAPADEKALSGLRESILALSNSLGVQVPLD
ncbi:MAG: hypothetical protein EYC70_01550 [Planctomycetota bacterium]|nr:MAG: hypothetical protein EYC70_01550 [Planctomycetota bacterium]